MTKAVYNKHAKELALIRDRIADTQEVIAALRRHEQEYVVASAAGDGTAISKVNDLRRAERELADLLVAEPLAAERVAADERRAAVAAARVRAREVIRERIEDAIEIRRLKEAFDARCSEFTRKGQELISLLPPQGHNSFSVAEQTIGNSRLMVELPATVFRLVPNCASFMPSAKYSTSLEQSERLYWQAFLNEQGDKAA
jgi:hypothetical protein